MYCVYSQSTERDFEGDKMFLFPVYRLSSRSRNYGFMKAHGGWWRFSPRISYRAKYLALVYYQERGRAAGWLAEES